MTIHPGHSCIIIRPIRNSMVFLFIAILSLVLPTASSANPDVYSVLPADIRILQHSLADFDGDAREELAILYTTSDETRLTIFRGDSGHWTRWWDDNGRINLKDGSAPLSLETVDTNGDGKAEILTYYLTERNTAMAARIMTLDNKETSNPAFLIILEDTTSPAGYPLLGTEKQTPSITFMRMATRRQDGYRRVYCWNGEEFEKCKEVVWKKP